MQSRQLGLWTNTSGSMKHARLAAYDSGQLGNIFTRKKGSKQMEDETIWNIQDYFLLFKRTVVRYPASSTSRYMANQGRRSSYPV
jgi:hypothetical protein